MRHYLPLALLVFSLAGCGEADPQQYDPRDVRIEFHNATGEPLDMWISGFEGDVRLIELMGTQPPGTVGAEEQRIGVVAMDRFEAHVWTPGVVHHSKVVPFNAASCSADPLVLLVTGSRPNLTGALVLEAVTNCG